MRVTLTDRFQRNVRELTGDQRAVVFEVMLALPDAIGRPHLHSGLGLRKIHPSGIWEGRVGLGLRLVFALGKDELILARLGTHDDIRRYLRTL